MASTINATTSGIVTIGDSVATLSLQTGGNTAVAIDTAQIVSLSKSLALLGSTSGSVTIAAPAVAGTQAYTLPTAAPAANGYALTSTTGGVMSWAAAGGSPAGSNTQVQYNSSGAFAGSANMTFDGTSLTVNTVKIGLGLGAVSSNTAVGSGALAANTSGATNTAFGNNALAANTTGSFSTAFGASALASQNGAGQQNTAIGRFALTALTTGTVNTAVGVNALLNLLTGNNNTAIGDTALQGVTGSDNIGLGRSSGNTLTSGSNCIFIGGDTRPSGPTTTHEIVIATVAGTNGKGANTGFINPNSGGNYQGNNSAAWSVTSDQRLKKNIVDNDIGLTAINAVRVRNFEYRLPEEVEELAPECAIAKPGVQLGVIAQELQTVLPDCVKQESTGVLSVDSDNLTWHMVNAIKQLSTALDAANARIAALEAK